MEWKGAAHVHVEDEESFGSTFEDGISEMVETSGRAQSLVFSEVFDADIWEFFGRVLEEVFEDRLPGVR
jgi:hypothetical protein